MDEDARRQAIEIGHSLEKRGMVDAAVQAFSRAGEIDEAARVLVAAQRFIDAGQFLLNAVKVARSADIAALDAAGRKQVLRAGICFSKAGESKRAADLFVALGEHARAVDLLRRAGDETAAARILASMPRRERNPTPPVVSKPMMAGGSAALRAAGAGPAAAAATGSSTLAAAQRLEEAGQHKAAMEAYVELKRFGDAARTAHRLKLWGVAADFYSKAAMQFEAAECYARDGETGKALEHYARISREDKNYRAACIGAIKVAAELNVLEFELEHFLTKFVTSEPQNDGELDAFYLLAALYRQHDFADNARDALEKVVRYQPNYRDAAKRLKSLADEEVKATPAVYQKIWKSELQFRGDQLRAPPPAHAPPAKTTSRPLDGSTIHERGLSEPAGPVAAAPQKALTVEQSAHHGVSAPTPAPATPSQTPSPTPIDANSLQPGAVIAGRYKLERKVGSGGMAVVFAARDLELHEAIAMKFITAGLDDERNLVRFRQEVSLARQLAHPNIVRLYDIGTHDGLRYITMELLQGRDLRSIVDEPITMAQSLEYLIQSCAGLGYAHSCGIVHRDMKPENLFITQENVVKVTDFGIAKRQATRGVTVAGFVVGTPEYMAPEQINDFASVTFAADIYSLGIVAYRLFAGRVPFDHPDMMPLLMMHIRDVPTPLRQVNARVPEELEQLVMDMLEKDPKKRPANCEEVGARLAPLRARLPR